MTLIEKIAKEKMEAKEIKGFENYIVYKDGRVFNTKKGNFLAQANVRGYLYVLLSNGPTRKMCRVHRLLAQAFIPNQENKTQVNHKNGIKNDNRLENLEWATPRENTQHAWNTGLCVIDENKRKTLSKNGTLRRKIVLNTENGIFYESIKEAAKYHGYEKTHLSAILRGVIKRKTSLIVV